MIPYPLLREGARVALVAPAGPLRVPTDVDRAVKNAKEFGWEPVLGENVKARHKYLAGTDEQRLADLNKALRDDSIDAVWCLRGGYGAMRLLEDVDYAALKKKPKTVIGYSDITALHAAIANRVGLSSLHGPTARTKFTDFTERSFLAAVRRDGQPCGDAKHSRTLQPGRARGPLVGGNLAMLCALHGTPYQPRYEGAILVLEDVNEAPYRIERLLLQLRLSGSLQSCAGIAFGSFTNRGVTEDKGIGGSRSLEDVLEEAAAAVKVPAITGIPLGHIDDQWSIPLGVDAELDADTRTLTVLQS